MKKKEKKGDLIQVKIHTNCVYRLCIQIVRECDNNKGAGGHGGTDAQVFYKQK